MLGWKVSAAPGRSRSSLPEVGVAFRVQQVPLMLQPHTLKIVTFLQEEVWFNFERL